MLSKSLISIVIFWEVGIYLILVLDFNLVFFLCLVCKICVECNLNNVFMIKRFKNKSNW